MNLILNELMANAAGQTSPIEAKKQSLAGVAQEKKTALSPLVPQTPAQLYAPMVGAATGKGVESASEQEYDTRYMTPGQLETKYGHTAASDLINAKATAQQRVFSDQTQVRDFEQAAADTVSGVGLGIANSIGGIGALAAGAVNQDAGIWASKQLDDLNAFGQGSQSPALQQRRNILAAKNLLDQRDSTQQFNKDKAEGKSDFTASLARIGRDVVSSVENAAVDPITLSEGIAQGVGSMLSLAPLGRAVAGARGGEAAIAAGIGAMEAGGSYQQGVNDVLAMSKADLQKNSPMYRELIAQGVSPDEAQRTVANRTALTSAAITAPAAVAAGSLVSKFAGNPTALVGGRQALANIGRETIEEGLQSGTASIAGNQAIQSIADNTRALSEGVGEQIGTGALYGLGTAGAIQAPSLAGAAAVATGSAAIAGLGATLGRIGDARADANRKNSPNSIENVTAAVNVAQAEAPAVQAAMAETLASAPPEVATAAQGYLDSLVQALTIDPAELQHQAVAATGSLVADAPNRLEAINRLINVVKATEGNPQQQLTAAYALYQLMQPMNALAENEISQQEGLPADAGKILDTYSDLVARIIGTPEVSKAFGSVIELLNTPAVQAQLNEVNQTPETAQVVVAAAELAPQTTNPAAVDAVLKMARDGQISLTDNQLNSLRSARALMRSAMEYDNALTEAGIQERKDMVGVQVKTGTESARNVVGARSGLQHARYITDLVNQNDVAGASTALEDLGKFAQNQANKVEAINQNFAGGRGAPRVKPLALSKTREWVESGTAYGVTPTNTNSLKNAQNIAAEATFLTQLHNQLVEAYPQLKLKAIAPVQLDAILQGDVDEVAAEFVSGARSYGNQNTNTPADATADAGRASEGSPAQTQPAESAGGQGTVRSDDGVVGERVSAPAVAKPDGETGARTDVPANTQPALKEEAKPEPVEQPVVVEEPAAPAPTGFAAVFPELVGLVPNGKVKNFLAEAFKLPKNQRSRILGSGSPLVDLRAALRSDTAASTFMGKPLKGELTKDVLAAYRHMTGDVANYLKQVMDRNLQQAGNAKKGKSSSLFEMLESGVANPLGYIRGRALNIVEPKENGKGFQYNQELVEGAILAGMHWIMNASSTGPIREAADIAALMNIPESQVTDALIAEFNYNGSMTKWDVIPMLAQKISAFWGLQANNDYSQSMVDGIPYAVASEVVRALSEMGALKQENISMPGISQELTRFTIDYDNLGEEYKAYPALLEELVAVEPEETAWFGEDRPKVARTQMNNTHVENTPEQRAAIEAEQNTPFFVNIPMFDLFQQLGSDNLLDLFGAGSNLNPETHNKQNLMTLQGRNASIAAAFQHMTDRFSELSNRAQAAGVPVQAMPMHYAYNMSRVGRMQMLGKHNPQASKLVREVFMPTRATVDLTDGDTRNLYMLSLAQALDIKVHTMPLADSIERVQAKLDGPLKPAVDLLAKFLATDTLDNDALEVLQGVMGDAGNTVMAVHAILDYARTTLPDTDLTNYDTSIYLEADGVTNGPVNAMAMLSTGKFNLSWLKNIAKGGWNLTPGKTFNEHRAQDNVDLYKDSTNNFAKRRTLLRDELSESGNAIQMDNLMKLMGMFIKDITVTESGEVLLDRGVAKNPLTITIYGSGARGIAGNVTKALMDEIYAKMTAALQNQEANGGTMAQAMFGDQASALKSADQLMGEFQFLINRLTRTELRNSKTKGYYVTSTEGAVPVNLKDLASFELPAANYRGLEENIFRMFVGPLREGISDTIGQSLLDSSELLQTATQLQSLAMAAAFKSEVERLVAEQVKENPDDKTLFLSRNQQDAVIAALSKKFPFVKTGKQTFFVTGNARDTVDASDFSRALNNTLDMQAMVFGPSDAGVAGAPYLIIGMGDGLMMQTVATAPDAVTGTLKIFDGMNMPIDQINKGSLQANEAVATTWQGNPLRAVERSFQMSLPGIENWIKTLPENDDGSVNLTARIAYSDKVSAVAAMTAMLDRVRDAADQIDARHAAMKRVSFSLDQMASAGQPFQNTGEDLSSLTPEAQVERLNQIYEEELAKISKVSASAAEIRGAATGKEPMELTERVLYTPEGLLREVGALPADLRQLAVAALRSPSMRDYTVVVASADQINAETGGALGNASGITMPAAKKIYLTEDSPEVRVHELVHAATFEAVLAHYQGNSTPAVAAAVERLEVLQDQFLGLDLREMTPDQVRAFTMAENSMIQALLQGGAVGKAASLNEFMAWATTNQELIAVGKKTESNPLVRMAKAVVKAIKGMFWKDVNDSLFSQVQFNTAVIMSAQPTTQQVMDDVVLEHSSAYGNDQRLQEVDETFTALIGDYLNAPGPIKPTAAVKAALANFSGDLSLAAKAVFPMTMQEQNVFTAIATALATEAAIEPTVLAKAQQLYAYVTKNLTVESFMANPEVDDPADRYYAQEKYDFLVGKSTMLTDAQGRSSLLPAFLALATTNQDFREVLRKMDMPKADKVKGRTMDDYLRNYGNHMMENLSNRMAGTNKSTDVRSAIDALNGHLYELSQNKQTLVSTFSDKAGGLTDRANEFVVDKLTTYSDKVMKKARDVKAKTNSKLVKNTAGVVELVAGLATEKNGQLVAEGVMSGANRIKGWKPLTDVIGDFVGRTESNANVYDLIKAVRSSVQAMRQQFRENVPEEIAKKFTRQLTEAEWTGLHAVMGKSDLAVLAGRGFAEVSDLVTKPKVRAAAIAELESSLSAVTGKNWGLTQDKAKQLATFMTTGVTGVNLLRNATAVSKLLGHGVQQSLSLNDTNQLDELITLYALDSTDTSVFASLVQEDQMAGLEFTMAYLTGQRKDEATKANASDAARHNAYKGYIPTVPAAGVSLIVADDAQHASLLQKSYVRVATYGGSTVERTNKGYYFAPVPTRAGFSQGIMQNVNITAGGVSSTTGFGVGMNAGVITDPNQLNRLKLSFLRDRASTENLVAVYNENGEIVAFERSLDPTQLERVRENSQLHKMLGVWRGRQVEEETAGIFNSQLINRLDEMYKKDLAAGKAAEYVNIFAEKDRVLSDAVRLLPQEALDEMENITGLERTFMVRRDMLNDALGYRSASIGDPWTGNSRWSQETQDTLKKLALGLVGNKAYQYAMNSERFIQGYVSDAKTLIVVKSVVVPFGNLLSNLYQLVARGVPLKDIYKNSPKKAHEVDSYVKGLLRQVAAEAELRAAVDKPLQKMKLEAEIQSIKDAHKRLSIWPLIEAGEFSAISDVGLTHEDIDMTEGKLNQYIEKLVGKLPDSVRNAGRYAFITKDTALFQGLQKAVQYGDFLAKAMIYDDLTKRQGKSKKDALAIVTEEFVNYDRLPGRFRGYMESMGLMWFYNFKIRAAKVGLSMIRNNPVHTLIASLAPAPDLFGPIGLPTEDNAFAKLAEGTLDNSMGPGQGMRAPMLNPWLNIIN